jgi:hypothetical protein
MTAIRISSELRIQLLQVSAILSLPGKVLDVGRAVEIAVDLLVAGTGSRRPTCLARVKLNRGCPGRAPRPLFARCLDADVRPRSGVADRRRYSCRGSISAESVTTSAGWS